MQRIWPSPSQSERLAAGGAALACALLGVVAPQADAAVFNVLNTNDSGAGSLRAAMETANGNADADTIQFAIGLAGSQHTIAPASPLPAITAPLTMDGSVNGGTASAFPLIELNGTFAGSSADGLVIATGAGVNGGASTTLRWLAVNRFGGAGVRVNSNAPGAHNLGGIFAGVDPGGTIARPNTDGIVVASSGGVTVGSPSFPNVVSGNNDDGIVVTGANVKVQSSYIGVDGATANADLGNAGDGIDYTGNPGLVGGTAVNVMNVISGNGAAGVRINAPSLGGENVDVQGNYIGLGTNGTTAVPNNTGILIAGAVNAGTHLVGGTAAGAGNVISSNTADGIRVENAHGLDAFGNKIGTNAAGTADRGNGEAGIEIATSDNDVGDGTAAGMNIISGNNGDGVLMTGAGSFGNRVHGNRIGTSADGTAAIGNSGDGVRMASTAGHNRVGDVNKGNVISGNGSAGIELEGTTQAATVAGNRIGTNADGTAALGNAVGVRTTRPNSTIGGTPAAGAAGWGACDDICNVISGNSGPGVELDPGSAGSLVRGNHIGLSASGAAALGNTGAGVLVDGNGSTIGGAQLGQGNAISANSPGVSVRSGGTGTVIQGNRIGVNATNDTQRGNTGGGVVVDAISVDIGGTASGAGNLIAGNASPLSTAGIEVQDGAAGLEVLGNRIGGPPGNGVAIDADAGATVTIGGAASVAGNTISGNFQGIVAGAGTTILGNTISDTRNQGIDLYGSATVGGTGAGEGNDISDNDGSGVRISGGSGNIVHGNSMHSNGGEGAPFDKGVGAIDILPKGMGNPANDAGDGDAGVNGQQNFPVLSAAPGDGSKTRVEGTLSSKPSTAYAIDIYSNTACDPSGHGEGRTFLGTAAVATDGAGNASFTNELATVAAGSQITATATGPEGTSEFSQCVPARSSGIIQAASAEVSEASGTATITVTRAADAAGAASIDYATSDGTAGPLDYQSSSGTLSFAGGETTKTFQVTLIDDTLVEDPETVTVTLSNVRGYGFGGTPATLTITSEDAAPITETPPAGGGTTTPPGTDPGSGGTQPDPNPGTQPPPGAATKPRPPDSNIARFRTRLSATRLLTVRGTASDPDGNLARVEVALVQATGGARAAATARPACRILGRDGKLRRARLDTRRRCRPRIWLRATGTKKWLLKLKRRLPRGSYVLYSRAIDKGGLKETTFSARDRNRLPFRLG